MLFLNVSFSHHDTNGTLLDQYQKIYTYICILKNGQELRSDIHHCFYLMRVLNHCLENQKKCTVVNLTGSTFLQWSITSLCCSTARLCPTLWTPWTAARQASLSFTISRSLLKRKFIELVTEHFM